VRGQPLDISKDGPAYSVILTSFGRANFAYWGHTLYIYI